MKMKQNPFFIGEIGINHNGDVKTALKLIDMAIDCKVDVVKFQKRTPELCVPVEVRNNPRETPWGMTTYFEYKKHIEFGEQEFNIIDTYCKHNGIMWSASAWDIPSVDFLLNYDIPFIKVPSAKLTDKDFLIHLKNSKKPIILSTGMSSEHQIIKAVQVLKGSKLSILHCNSSYPSNEDELNLSYILKLKQMFPAHTIGYSGHERGIASSLMAGILGAEIIERHITLDRAMWGTDQSASLERRGLKTLIRDLNKINVWYGNGIKIVTNAEKSIMPKLRDRDTL